MGGYGSGQQDGRPIVDEAMRIEWDWMLRTERAVPGQRITGSLHWTCRGESAGQIGYVCDMIEPEASCMGLLYTIKNRHGGTSQNQDQQVRLSFTEPNYGGKRWWMHCPVNGDRVSKLYFPAGGDIFASRRAWNLGYSSQREASRDQVFSKLFKLQSRLGCEQGWERPIRRPKGMWRRTYARYEREYWELNDQCGMAMMGVLKMIPNTDK